MSEVDIYLYVSNVDDYVSHVDIIYGHLMFVSDVDIYMSDVDIIYVYQIWMFMDVRCRYYLYVSDVIYKCQM